MILTKAIVKRTCDTNSNYYFVYIPLLRKANDSEEDATLKAVRSTIKGLSDDLKVGDVVYVSFEDTEYGRPVILGKLYTGTEEDISANFILRSLRVTDKVVLPGDTVIGDLTLDKLKDLVYENTNTKQERLVSGENIKTINNISLLGSGNITIQGGGGEPDNYLVSASVSGNNLTLNPNTGDAIVYGPSVNWGDIEGTLSDQTDLQAALDTKLELYEITPSDIENVVSGNIIFTEDFSDKIRSMKYLLKVNKQLFDPEAEDEDIYLKPEARETMNGYETYTYASISGFFETYVDSVIFGYDPSIDRCLSNNDLVHHIVMPQTIVADNNSIQLDSGDGGRIGGSVYIASVNGHSILNTSSNIEIPNDYHEPRFSSGLSIASSSNVSEIHVPYATSSTYGVVQDLYSNYVPYANASRTVDLNSQSFIARGIWFYGASSASGSSTVYTAAVIYNSSNNALRMANFGEISIYGKEGITLSTGKKGSGLKQSNTDIVLLPTSKAYYGSSSDPGNEIARISDIQGFVPYTGASDTVDLGQNYLHAMGITIMSQSSSYPELVFVKKDANDDITDVVRYGPDEIYFETSNSGEYALVFPKFPDGSNEVLATETYVQANAVPSSTPMLLSTIKIGSWVYAIPSQSGQGQFIPLSGTANLSGNIVPGISSGYSYTLGGSNREFAALHVKNIYGAAYEGLAVVATGGPISMVGVSGVGIIAYSDIGMYASNTVSIRGEYGVDIRAQYDIDITAENNGDVNITADNDVHVIGGSFTFNSAPVATEVYVDNHHTMVNATSLTDVDIDKILVKGGIVILDDEQLSLTLAPPGEQLSLTMTNSINNDSTLSPTMLNTIDNSDNAGLTPTIVSTELSI